MLFDDIKKDLMESKKVKDILKSNLLSTLYSDIYSISKSGKELTDEDSYKVIKKFIKNVNETLSLEIPENSRSKYLAEKEILESYLPKQLSREEIDKIVSEQLDSGKTIKDIMVYFKENYSGHYDGKTVSDSVKAKQG
ncbi:MAG: GatB/YqeY domain-containing protein [Ignavibacteria bacterium]